MKYIASVLILFLAGCATVETTITGPGYRYVERIRAIGGGNIEKVSKTLGGTLKVFNEDGTPLVDVELDSVQETEGMTSDMEAILTGLRMLGSLGLPGP